MANVNNEVTVMLSDDDMNLLIEAIKTCKQIAESCNNLGDMFIDASTVFAEIYDNYKNDKLPAVILLHE